MILKGSRTGPRSLILETINGITAACDVNSESRKNALARKQALLLTKAGLLN